MNQKGFILHSLADHEQHNGHWNEYKTVDANSVYNYNIYIKKIWLKSNPCSMYTFLQ